MKYVGSLGIQSIRDWSTGKFAALAHSHDVATAESDGLMSASDKAKLDGLGDSGGDFLTDEEFLAAVIS